jgi:hypothetical protein
MRVISEILTMKTYHNLFKYIYIYIYNLPNKYNIMDKLSFYEFFNIKIPLDILWVIFYYAYWS